MSKGTKRLQRLARPPSAFPTAFFYILRLGPTGQWLFPSDAPCLRSRAKGAVYEEPTVPNLRLRFREWLFVLRNSPSNELCAVARLPWQSRIAFEPEFQRTFGVNIFVGRSWWAEADDRSLWPLWSRAMLVEEEDIAKAARVSPALFAEALATSRWVLR